MRVDTLSLLLSMANIGAYSDVLVVDMVGGLIVGAVAERLGGKLYLSFTYLIRSNLIVIGWTKYNPVCPVYLDNQMLNVAFYTLFAKCIFFYLYLVIMD